MKHNSSFLGILLMAAALGSMGRFQDGANVRRLALDPEPTPGPKPAPPKLPPGSPYRRRLIERPKTQADHDEAIAAADRKRLAKLDRRRANIKKARENNPIK